MLAYLVRRLLLAILTIWHFALPVDGLILAGDVDDNAIRKAQVLARRVDARDQSFSTASDERGHFLLTGLEALLEVVLGLRVVAHVDVQTVHDIEMLRVKQLLIFHTAGHRTCGRQDEFK